MFNLLILENSKLRREILKKALLPQGYNIFVYPVEKFHPNLVDKNINFILINLDERNSNISDWIEKIRKSNPSIVMIGLGSAITTKKKKHLLELGLDDYFVSPFQIEDLVIKLNTYQRRITQPRTKEIIGNKRIKVNLGTRTVKVNNKIIKLRKKEFNILEYLIRNAPRVVTRSELLNNIWDYHKIVTSNTVDVHIKSLRDKLPEGTIKTIYGQGYQFESADTEPEYLQDL